MDTLDLQMSADFRHDRDEALLQDEDELEPDFSSEFFEDCPRPMIYTEVRLGRSGNIDVPLDSGSDIDLISETTAGETVEKRQRITRRLGQLSPQMVLSKQYSCSLKSTSRSP